MPLCTSLGRHVQCTRTSENVSTDPLCTLTLCCLEIEEITKAMKLRENLDILPQKKNLIYICHIYKII